MSRALQKYAQQRGIALGEAGAQEEGDAGRGEMAIASQQAQMTVDQGTAQEAFEKGEVYSGVGLGGGLTVGKIGEKIRGLAGTGKKVLSAADSASQRASRLARATGSDSVADGIDAARQTARNVATRVGDTASSLTDSAKGVSQVSRSGLDTLGDNLTRLRPQLIDAGSDSQILPIRQAQQTANISDQATGTSNRSMMDRLLGRNQPEPELEDETTRLANIRETRQAAGDFDEPQDQDLLSSIRDNPNLNPSLTASDQAVSGDRSIGDVAKSFAEQTPDDLIAGGTDAGRIARGVVPATQDVASGVQRGQTLLGGLRGDQTLARATQGADNPFSFRNFGVSEDDLGGPARTSKFGDVLQTNPDEVAPPLEGSRITSSQPRAQPPAQPDTLDPNATPSGGANASSNLGRNGGTSQADLQARSTSSQADASLDQQISKDAGDLGQKPSIDKPSVMDDLAGEGGEGAGEALSIGDKFLKYGGAALEGVGMLADVASMGYGIYEMTQIPAEERKLAKEQKDLTTAEQSQAAPGKVTYGDIAGATLDTAPAPEGGTFSHF